MSPDETANAVSAISFVRHQSFVLPYDLVRDFPWAVPRSFVALPGQGSIAQVGFLGMPWLLALAYWALGISGLLLLTPVLALLSLWPLYRSLPRSWSGWVKYLVLLVWMTYPPVIVYANRSVFPNLVIVCLAIWIWWLLVQAKGHVRWLAIGSLGALACLIRPPEIIWLAPLAVCAGLYSQALSHDGPGFGWDGLRAWTLGVRKKPLALGMFVLGCLPLLLYGAYLGHATYGQWLISGYQVRPDMAGETVVAASSAVPQAASLLSTLPFALHPRNIAWNLYHYLVIFLWPWALVLGAALILFVREKVWRRPEKWVVLGLGWTVFWLVAFYGNGIYQDHVGTNVVSLGNSYLRYILPLSVVFALAAGMVLSRMWRFWYLRLLAICLAVLLAVLGSWNALARDDESMLANQRELARYAQIRDAAKQRLHAETVVMSDRSDKIFFPEFQTVSPLPNDEELSTLLKSGHPVAVFLPTQDAAGLTGWSDRGFGLRLLFTNGTQSLYDVH